MFIKLDTTFELKAELLGVDMMIDVGVDIEAEMDSGFNVTIHSLKLHDGAHEWMKADLALLDANLQENLEDLVREEARCRIEAT